MDTRVSLAVLLGVTLAACAGPRVYGVRFGVEGRRDLASAAIPPLPDTGELLRQATTIAFAPPDACRDVKAAGAGAAEVGNVMRLSCGVLMTELESAAARAGFQVVSWQALRGSAPAIAYAKDNKVDVLFELNDLSFDVPVQDLYTFTDVAFFDRTDGAAENPLVVTQPQDTGMRCQQQFLGSFDPTMTVTLDAKLVSVADGRVRWTYRETLRDRPDERVEVVKTWWADPLENNVVTAGAAFGVLGFSVALGGLFGEYVDGDVALGRGMQRVGLGGMAVGAVILAVSALVPPDYPPPAQVLCLGQAREDQRVVTAPAAGAPATSANFATKAQVKAKEEELRRTKLLNAITAAFIGRIADLRGAPAR